MSTELFLAIVLGVYFMGIFFARKRHKQKAEMKALFQSKEQVREEVVIRPFVSESNRKHIVREPRGTVTILGSHHPAIKSRRSEQQPHIDMVNSPNVCEFRDPKLQKIFRLVPTPITSEVIDGENNDEGT